MTASVRPTPIHRRDWRVVPVSLSADEQVALNMLAARECREREDMAARLIVLALEEHGLLPLSWPLKWPPAREGEKGGKGEGEITPAPPLPRSPAPRQGETPDAV